MSKAVPWTKPDNQNQEAQQDKNIADNFNSRLQPNMNHRKYDHILEVLQHGSIEDLERIAQTTNSFPSGKDDFVERYWILNAIDCGSLESIRWMLSKKVPLDFRNDEGFTAILWAMDCERPDQYEVLELLINSGAPINKQGLNDWTPLHWAAVRNDIKALKILVEHGADPTIRTRIDNYATPREEAWHLGHKAAVRFLESIESQHRKK